MSHSPYILPPATEKVNQILGIGADLNDKLLTYQRLQPRLETSVGDALRLIQGEHEVRIPHKGRFKMQWHDQPEALMAALNTLSAEGKTPRLLIIGPSATPETEAQVKALSIPQMKLFHPLHATDVLDTVRQNLHLERPSTLLIKGDTPEVQPATTRIGESMSRHGFSPQTFDHMRDWDARTPLSARPRPTASCWHTIAAGV